MKYEYLLDTVGPTDILKIDYLNQKGKDGWELVESRMVPGFFGNQNCEYTFKRKIL